MSPFEFMFSLFGLLLGLSIAEIAGGFSRAYDARAERSMGWMAPALAIILLLDLLSFWYCAWAWRDTSLSFVIILTAAVVGLLYYFAATQVFPREGVSTRPSDHFMMHRGPVAFCVIVANLIMFAPNFAIAALAGDWPDVIRPELFANLGYFILLGVAGFHPNRRWIGASLLLAVILLIGFPVMSGL